MRLLSYEFPEGQENFEDGSDDCAVAEVVVVAVAAADSVPVADGSLRIEAFEGLYLFRSWLDNTLMTYVLCFERFTLYASVCLGQVYIICLNADNCRKYELQSIRKQTEIPAKK